MRTSQPPPPSFDFAEHLKSRGFTMYDLTTTFGAWEFSRGDQRIIIWRLDVEKFCAGMNHSFDLVFFNLPLPINVDEADKVVNTLADRQRERASISL